MLGALFLGLEHMSMSELTLMSEPARRVEIFTGAGRRRRWSDSEKMAIVAESYSPGSTACSVARRHGLTPQQLFTWRRQARIGREEVPPFVPVVVDATPTAWGIEIDIDGAAVRIGAAATPAVIEAVIRALKAHR